MKKLFLPVLLCVLFLGVASEASAQRWRILGSKNVANLIDHDTISVTSLRGDFRKIKLKVLLTPVRFYRVVVHFSAGDAQRVTLRQLIKAGGETRAIDLNGRERHIRSVEFWYAAKSLLGRDGRIVLYGQD